MRILLLFILVVPALAQNLSVQNSNGQYSAGFKTLLLSDNSREFKFKNQTNSTARPIRIFVWYPTAKVKNPKLLKFAEYVYASSLAQDASRLSIPEKGETERKLVSNLEFFKVSAEQISFLMNGKTKAIANAPEISKKFPLIVSGNVGEGFYYYATAEFLAANGFVVISLPSLGANEDERCGFDLNCLKLQQADMEFAIEKMRESANVDASKIGFIGWSFSGLAVAHQALKNQAVKAVVSLDAATGYQYGKEILDQSKILEINKTTVPFLHFHGLKGSSRVPKNFDFFNAYQAKEKRLAAFKNLQHSDFIALYGFGVRYAKNETDEKAVSEIEKANLITFEFLNAYLNNNRKSLKRLDKLLKSL